MASCCSSSHSKKTVGIVIAALVLVVVIVCCVLMSQPKPQKTNTPAPEVAATEQSSDASSSSSQEKKDAKQAQEKATKKTNDVAHKQYATVLKDAPSWLTNDAGKAFAHYYYLTQDINKDKIDDLILLGSDDPQKGATCVAAVCVSGGSADNMAHPSHTFKLSADKQAPALLFSNTKDDTLLYVVKGKNAITQTTYALFDGEFHEVNKKDVQPDSKNYGVDATTWALIDTSTAQAIDTAKG